ncbi:peroxiredoxin-like family protein [Flavivirga algicola]|uniref:thioredoxin-dependent peroxiredoxin n=1 Tax=Flavivirga algicola TaxID=2729136 RepID=A0ABX1RZN3_9FLAO|nr:peroxiredoxin-like family protein [Flavivirga algicola]NMH89042.1 AhpC/TSA family protein [Flavivirga algicola]
MKENDKAIDFTLEDYLGNAISLTKYKGQKILLSFFRGASCPFCNLRIHQLIKRYPDFENTGIQIITVFAATKKEILSYAGQQNAPFHILADPTLKLYKKYGIKESLFGMLKTMISPLKMVKVMFSGFFNMKSIKDKPIVPADFLIDENFMILQTYYGKDFGDHIPIEKVLDWK